MSKLKMHSPDLTAANVAKLKDLLCRCTDADTPPPKQTKR